MFIPENVNCLLGMKVSKKIIVIKGEGVESEEKSERKIWRTCSSGRCTKWRPIIESQYSREFSFLRAGGTRERGKR